MSGQSSAPYGGRPKAQFSVKGRGSLGLRQRGVLERRPWRLTNLFRHRHGLWFLDNVAAVMTLVRGRSSNADLAKLGHLIHLALFALRAQGYWEYIQSKSNWADDISRLGVNDPWWRCHGFNFYSSYLPTILFQLPFVAVILTFEFL